MHFSSNSISDHINYRAEEILEFLQDGWGCVRKNTILNLFHISEEFLEDHVIKFIDASLPADITLCQEEDYFYIHFYQGYRVEKKYMNVLSVLSALAQTKKDSSFIITDNMYTKFFTAKMYLKTNDREDEIRTYYTIDTAETAIPLYAMEDILRSEVYTNGFQFDNCVIIIVYDERDIEYMDLPCPVFFALQDSEMKDNFKFFSNDRLRNQ